MMPEIEAPPCTPPKIMIVEDEGLIAADIEIRLRQAGYNVVAIVDTGSRAVQTAAAEKPDLIVMDVHLKGDMDGIDAARAIGDEHDIPVLYLTAHTGNDMLERARTTAPFGYLAKPAGYASLPTSIEVALWKHRAERELRQQRAWLGTVLRNMADGVIVVDAGGLIQFLNPAAEALTGWTADSARGVPLCTVLRLYNPELDRFLDDLLPAALAAGSPEQFASGLQIADKDNRYFPIEGEIAPSSDGGKVVGAVISFRDATVRRIEEHELRQREKLQAVACLAAGVAHDFNNALTVIGGYAEVLRSELRESILLPLADEIAGEARRASEITRRMLAVSGRQPERRQPLNVNAVITEWRDFFSALLGPGMQFRVNLAPDLQEVFADFGDIEEVLVNLLSNARKALAAEGGCVSLTTANVALGGDSPANDYIAITVADNGLGLDPAVVERIFEPFFTTGALGSGTGLGLFIVHHIVTELGGSVAVESHPGQGTTFTVYLPAARQGRPMLSARMPFLHADTSTRPTILLADGDEEERTAISAQLSRRGYEVLECSDGRSALSMARRRGKPFALLIVDMHLPGINGFRLATHLARLAPDLNTVFLSNHAGALVSTGMSGSNWRFVSKPVVESELTREVEAALRTSTAVLPQ